MRAIISIFAVAVFIISCAKEIPYVGDESEEKLVLESVTIEGDTIKVRTDYSRFFLSNEAPVANFQSNIKLTLVDNTSGTTYSALPYDEELMLHLFPVVAVSGHSYTITAAHPNYPTASASATVQKAPSIELISSTKVYQKKGQF